MKTAEVASQEDTGSVVDSPVQVASKSQRMRTDEAGRPSQCEQSVPENVVVVVVAAVEDRMDIAVASVADSNAGLDDSLADQAMVVVVVVVAVAAAAAADGMATGLFLEVVLTRVHQTSAVTVEALARRREQCMEVEEHSGAGGGGACYCRQYSNSGRPCSREFRCRRTSFSDVSFAKLLRSHLS